MSLLSGGFNPTWVRLKLPGFVLAGAVRRASTPQEFAWKGFGQGSNLGVYALQSHKGWLKRLDAPVSAIFGELQPHNGSSETVRHGAGSPTLESLQPHKGSSVTRVGVVVRRVVVASSTPQGFV